MPRIQYITDSCGDRECYIHHPACKTDDSGHHFYPPINAYSKYQHPHHDTLLVLEGREITQKAN